ncbi:MAG: glycosyltransferase [Verrucomicrobiae bacterium]|nr:glycosyltransferase [Verrucomicrobiae bacterium]NNJ44002.1 glycosyltransferase [Akkermansiaceae bacterium]
MKFSIITICFNPGSLVLSAVESVLGQSYKDVEYIVVDGGSSDGAVEWLSEMAAKEPRMTLVSEPDDGLYDALNKGVRLATGDVIGFVHADDFLAHPDVLLHVAERFLDANVEAVYGDLQYITGRQELGRAEVGGGCRRSEEPHGKTTALDSPFDRSDSVIRYWRSGEYSRRKLAWGWMPPHPALYLKRDVYDRAMMENGEYFDSSFRCAADYDLMMRVLSKLNVCPEYLPEVLVKMRMGGVSNRSLRHIIRKSREDWRAIRRNKIGHFHTLLGKNFGKLSQFLRNS